LLALAPLALCVPVASEGCAGWRPVSISEQTLADLAANDTQALAEMTAHMEFGKENGCWK
jgi:hypothetical protein